MTEKGIIAPLVRFNPESVKKFRGSVVMPLELALGAVEWAGRIG